MDGDKFKNSKVLLLWMLYFYWMTIAVYGDVEAPSENNTHTNSSHFRCNNTQCSDAQLVCDEQIYYNNRSGEPGTHQCGHKCIKSLNGYYCECRQGYKLLTDNKTCIDINECLETPEVCSQHCENTPGSYRCQCNEQYYERHSNNYTCNRRDHLQPWLIFTSGYYIHNMSVDADVYNFIYQDLEGAVAFDFDIVEQKLYYCDDLGRVVFRASIAGGEEREPMIKLSVYQLGDMAIDWIGRKIYWLNRRSKSMEVSELNFTNRKTLHERIPHAKALVLHPGKGYLYFSSWRLQPFIAKLSMDGETFKVILNSDEFIAGPSALAIDYFADRLYWFDTELEQIASSDLDGKYRHIVISGSKVPNVFALSVFDDYIYWSDWNLKAISRANKNTGQDLKILKVTIHQPSAIRVYHPLRQLNYTNPCGEHNGGCSHLCLIAPAHASTNSNVKSHGEDVGTTYRCACPDQYYLAKDSNTCKINCTRGQWKCGGNEEKCIPWFLKCNGENDCKNGSDEPPTCPLRRCGPGTFQCRRRRCVPYSKVCDGKNNCRDNSDERNCFKSCSEFEFTCKSDGYCIPRSKLCDGHRDCVDYSDENPLSMCFNITCNPETEFRCQNGRCIPKLLVCNSVDNCGDRSDEPEHACRQKNCTAGWQRCPGNDSYGCIPKKLFCDGLKDCKDGSDELPENCPHCDPETHFKCANNLCIPKQWTCDFANNCGDESDEDEELCKGRYRQCSESEFQCGDGRCIWIRWRCDQDGHCGDDSDEMECQGFACRNGTFQCASGHCISSHLRCDGDKDCEDISDEEDCPPKYPNGRYCPESKFQCQNHLCVLTDFVCDGYDDCYDGSDESPDICIKSSKGG